MNTNIDQQEITKFNEMASQWWDPNGPCKPLHEINPIRLEFIQKYVELQNKNILDIGCGGGLLAEAMAVLGANVTGIDASLQLIKVAKLHAASNQIKMHYEHKTSTDLVNTAHKHQFHIITCMELLEHVPNPQMLIQECAELLNPDGYLFVSTINRNWKSYLFAILGAEYVLKLLPAGTHEYAKLIKPAELAQYARNADLKLIAMAGMDYNPLTKICRLSENLNVNYLAVFKK
ncbi:MAG: bifunctional 2-polyprenyl-6-hydroxyphenol methylase/3-demethylubiquinol 3-O-methyltransferase UbiG [Gammaproteobacteria bacterium]